MTRNFSTSSDFNLKYLQAVTTSLPKITRSELFCQPAIETRLKTDAEIKTAASASFFGIQIHVKPGQRMPAYMISDPEISRQYLNAEITEADLMRLLLDDKKTISAMLPEVA